MSEFIAEVFQPPRFIILVPIMFALIALAGAVVGAALAGVFYAASGHMTADLLPRFVVAGAFGAILLAAFLCASIAMAAEPLIEVPVELRVCARRHGVAVPVRATEDHLRRMWASPAVQRVATGPCARPAMAFLAAIGRNM